MPLLVNTAAMRRLGGDQLLLQQGLRAFSAAVPSAATQLPEGGLKGNGVVSAIVLMFVWLFVWL